MDKKYSELIQKYQFNKLDALKEFIKGDRQNALLRLMGQINLCQDNSVYQEYQIFQDYITLERFIVSLIGSRMIQLKNNNFYAMQDSELAKIAVEAGGMLVTQYNAQKAYDELWAISNNGNKDYVKMISCALAIEKAGFRYSTDHIKKAAQHIGIEESRKIVPAQYPYDPENGRRLQQDYLLIKQ